MSDRSEAGVDEGESDKQRPQETLGDMSISQLFELLAEIEAELHQRGNEGR
jgi:hypothetical protein